MRVFFLILEGLRYGQNIMEQYIHNCELCYKFLTKPQCQGIDTWKSPKVASHSTRMCTANESSYKLPKRTHTCRAEENRVKRYTWWKNSCAIQNWLFCLPTILGWTGGCWFGQFVCSAFGWTLDVVFVFFGDCEWLANSVDFKPQSFCLRLSKLFKLFREQLSVGFCWRATVGGVIRHAELHRGSDATDHGQDG